MDIEESPQWLEGKFCMSACEVRPASLADAPTLAGFMGELGYPTATEAMHLRMANILADDDYRTLVAVREGVVVGMVGLRKGYYYEGNGSYVHVMVLVVTEAERDRGFGSALMGAAEDWAARQGAELIMVNTQLHRHGAHAFYQQRGYRENGKRFVKKGPGIG